MHNIQFSDALYREASRKAKQEGYKSVDAYVQDVISVDIKEDPDNFDHIFTPEVIAELDQIINEMKAGGKVYTREEVDAHLAELREAWIRDHES